MNYLSATQTTKLSLVFREKPEFHQVQQIPFVLQSKLFDYNTNSQFDEVKIFISLFENQFIIVWLLKHVFSKTECDQKKVYHTHNGDGLLHTHCRNKLCVCSEAEDAWMFVEFVEFGTATCTTTIVQ